MSAYNQSIEMLVMVASALGDEFKKLLFHSDFEYAVQSTAQGQSDREALIFKRLEKMIG